MAERRFDLRTLERSLVRGRITQQEYDAFLGGLDDVAENCEPIGASIDPDPEEEAEALGEEEGAAADEDAPASDEQVVEGL